MALNKWIKKRIEFLEDLDDKFMSRVESLQRSLYEDIKDFFISDLDIEGNIIKTTTRNYGSVSRVDSVQRSFKTNKTAKLLRWMTRRFTDILSLNKRYFNEEDLVQDSVHNSVFIDMQNRVGFKKKDDLLYIKSGGWIDTLGNFQDPYLRVKEVAIQAIASGMTFEEFRKILKGAVLDPSLDSVKHHFYTNAYDAFTQFDRSTNYKYAQKLGMRAFRYSGGLIDTSRQFCIDRNAKIFTIDEAQEWINLTWNGKGKNYTNPIEQMGGHNCRHVPAFIPDAKAIKERPELKGIWDNQKANS